MELMLMATASVMGCIGQACCWHAVFTCCGCIDEPRHVIIERVVQPQAQSDNPFINSSIPKDTHLTPAYG